MKIGFVWYWDRASEVFDLWRDGLRGAMEVIEKKHDVDWFLNKTMPNPGEHDFLLFWSSSNEDYFKELSAFPCEKGLCLTTNPHNVDNLRYMDVIYCESSVVYNEVRAQGLRAIKAFGTDTDFFSPDKKVEKDIEYFYPATFSPWKRQSELAHLGDKLLCVGTVQPDGVGEYDACKKEGVKIEQGYFPAEKVRDYYRRSKKVLIPAIHGSERTVLEAMACDILPEVLHPEINMKTATFIHEFHNSKARSPREFVILNYSHRLYAQNILKGME